MRCKNCGFENEAERYICENCGSPLYDEDEDIATQQNAYSDGQPDEDDPIDDTDKKNTKNSIIIIAVLAVLLIAMITGIIILASQGGKAPEQTSNSTSTTEATEPPTSTTTQPTTTKPTTTKPSTTKPTTTKPTTTEPTTEPTTKETEPPIAEYHIAVDIDGNGTIAGDGTYKAGEKAILTATADADSQFIGWYDNATKELVASGVNYTVTVQRDLILTAKFQVIEQPEEEESEEETEEKAEEAPEEETDEDTSDAEQG